MPIRVCVAGITGWAGSAVAEAVEAAHDLALVAGVSRSDPSRSSTVAEALDEVDVDVLVDYTHADAVKENVHALSTDASRSSWSRAGSPGPSTRRSTVARERTAWALSPQGTSR